MRTLFIHLSKFERWLGIQIQKKQYFVINVNLHSLSHSFLFQTMSLQKHLRNRWKLRRIGGQQCTKPVLRRLMNDAINRIGAGKTNITSVAGRGEDTEGEQVRHRRGRDGGSLLEGRVLGRCVAIIIAAQLGKTSSSLEPGWIVDGVTATINARAGVRAGMGRDMAISIR